MADEPLMPGQHRARHEELHRLLDELAADYMACTGRLLGTTTVAELLSWSHRQTVSPEEPFGEEYRRRLRQAPTKEGG